MRLVYIALAVTMALPVGAQNFSCRMGTEPACLDYGDKVCSSRGKCVDDDAACFDQYQCNYEGFTCKSNVTACVDDHNVLVGKYNDLLSDHDTLIDKYNDLLSNYQDLVTSAKAVVESNDAIKFCLDQADDLDEAQACRWR